MLNLGSKNALPVGVKIETQIERALSVAVDIDRAALGMSTAMDRAALSVGVKFELRQELLNPWQQTRLEQLYPCLLPWIEHALFVS